MDRERLIAEGEKKKNIPGIYNYCDRWCERCPFSARCLSYALEKEDADDPDERNMSNQKFWEKLSETFKMTRELIKKAAEEQGMDLEELEQASSDDLHEKSHQFAENHPVARAARKYSKMTSVWFKEVDHLFSIDYNNKGNSLHILPTNAFKEADFQEVENAVSVIRWYQFQVSVKLMRALNGLVMEAEEDMLWVDHQKDSDGSAKVSLLGIDHSINGWGTLLKNFPSEENTILDMLVHLERLRNDIEREFPNARSFKRPGFDDESYGLN